MISAVWSPIDNWGDKITPRLIKGISGRDAIRCNQPKIEDHVLVCGSIASWFTARSTLYGVGCLTGSGLNPRQDPPKKIISVRGALTRQSFLNRGIECPEIYGDSGILFSKIYTPKIEKKYEVGIIPHYVDYNNPWLDRYKADPKVNVINIRGDINTFVDNVCSCEITLSSSLHGIVCSNSYNIPSYWVDWGGRILGNGFKFRDYWTSINYSGQNDPVKVNEGLTLSDITAKLQPYDINIDIDKLLSLNPFKGI